jgi:V8-like Glu-specific endopeptidase
MRRTAIVPLAAVLAAVAGTAPAGAAGRLHVGDVRPYHAESPHPYPLGAKDRPVVWTDRVISPGAAFVRVHFTGLSLAPGDSVTVASPDGAQAWTYTGKGPRGDGDLWSFAVEGDEAVVTIRGGRRSGRGYRIDKVGHGRIDPDPEVVCGTDGREDVACHVDEAGFDAAQRPVGRLLFVSGGFQYVCTGWLVAGSNASTLMTNNHCISNQTETNSLQATFNFQRSACGGGTNNATSTYTGGRLLRTNSVDRRGKKGGLDYTLLTLLGNPEAAWGELIATRKAVSVNDLIWFIQHPGGGVKEVGYWEDAAHSVRCAVDAVGATYGDSARNSQIGYACDSEGGSSGSPIVDPATGRAVAIHHFGGVSGSPCLNSGTAMAPICQDAGSLLTCASD